MTQAVLEQIKVKPKFKEDPLFSFIVPVYDISPMTLKRCLMSLQEQDYESMEVIIVFDGPNKELEKIADNFLTNTEDSHGFNSWRKIVIEHSGACEARNKGFEESKGEIISFFNSDYIAKPGMVRMWVDALLENKEFGFVYGGYEYSTNRRYVFPSGPFNEDQLFTENYIDCGFPLWRKYVEPWDRDVKSLQDWDFWIRVVKKHKVKGFYLGRDYSFIAELPRVNGLSHDSSQNWIDRVNFIKSKNGILNRDILVTSLGASNHAREIAKMIDGDFKEFTFDKPSEYKALYMIGFYIKPNELGLNEHARRLAVFKERYPKAKRVVHFVGADIYWLRKFPWESLKYLSGALRQSCDTILSENKEAHDELEEFGIPSQIVPIPSYTDNWKVKPLPDDFKVSIFLTDKSDFDKYCYEHTLSIVRGMPDIKFTAYGDGGKDVRYPNLKHYGNIPRDKWSDYVYENSALLRICKHDTLPMSSCEFLMAGRNVITNIPMEYAQIIDTSGKEDLSKWDKFGEGLNVYHWPQTKKKIIQMIRKLKNNPVYLDKAHYHYKILLNKQTYINKIKEFCHV